MVSRIRWNLRLPAIDKQGRKFTLSGLNVQEFTNFEDLSGLRNAWNELVRSEKYGPAQSYEWLSTLWDVNRAGRELLVLVFSDDAGLTGIAPLVKETEHRRGVKVTVLRMLSGFHALHGTPLLLARRENEVMDALFEYLSRKVESWTLWFNCYQVGVQQEETFMSSLRKRGCRFSTTPGERSPYQLLQETWEEKIKSLQPRFRTALRSREKRLREKGVVELKFFDSPDGWQEGLAAIREIEEDSWKIEAGTAITAQDFQWEFYSRYSPIASAAGTLKIPVLFLDGEPVAYDYALYEDGIYYLLKTSYKNKWRELYPGFVLRKMLVEWTYAHGGKEIDFLGKDEDWKMKWTDSVREHRDLFIYSRTLAARYLHGLHSVVALLQAKR